MVKITSKRVGIIALVALLLITISITIIQPTNSQQDVVRIGFIGGMSGWSAEFGSYQAVAMAVDEINAAGGINGKRIELIAEDGKCAAGPAITAADKLIHADGVKIILGGHCGPESIALAPIAEENQVLMLASISSTTKLPENRTYLLRTSSADSKGAEPVLGALRYYNVSKLAVIYEMTDYAQPIAERLATQFTAAGGEAFKYPYLLDNTDFKTIIAKASENNAQAVFISPHSPKTQYALIKQLREYGWDKPIFGNDQAGQTLAFAESPELQEGIMFANPTFDEGAPKTAEFTAKYCEKYGTNGLPYGVWTAESYDAAFILADAVRNVGEDPDAVNAYLRGRTYDGASGIITINEYGDGERPYVLKVVGPNGEIIDYKSPAS
ncbi:hypothetical protein AUJ14_00040 [Candidatus Micrarchaeota archaeon CG1_02_55_22]|nr:MAG: hypothetical protein AUJ14_00040 [Candidatus Micrarchaeota archaeon CG1_02_55_22]